MMQQQQTFTVPAGSHAAKILTLMDGLASALEDEITLLEKHEYSRHGEILKRKQELTLNYQASLKAIAENPEKATLLSPEERATLQSKGKILEAVTQRNAKAIRIAQAVSERLLGSMMNEVRKEVHKESSYSSSAVLTARQKEVMRPVAYSKRV
jgi:flagellar biosynthesis/type III secretory pathway chaperone